MFLWVHMYTGTHKRTQTHTGWGRRSPYSVKQQYSYVSGAQWYQVMTWLVNNKHHTFTSNKGIICGTAVVIAYHLAYCPNSAHQRASSKAKQNMLPKAIVSAHNVDILFVLISTSHLAVLPIRPGVLSRVFHPLLVSMCEGYCCNNKCDVIQKHQRNRILLFSLCSYLANPRLKLPLLSVVDKTWLKCYFKSSHQTWECLGKYTLSARLRLSANGWLYTRLLYHSDYSNLGVE